MLTIWQNMNGSTLNISNNGKIMNIVRIGMMNMHLKKNRVPLGVVKSILQVVIQKLSSPSTAQ